MAIAAVASGARFPGRIGDRDGADVLGIDEFENAGSFPKLVTIADIGSIDTDPERPEMVENATGGSRESS